MPDSKRFRKYFELEARATRWALNSTPSALTAKSVSRSSRQRATSEAWCGTPPRSVSLGAAVGCEEDEEPAAAVRARFFGGMARRRTRASRNCVAYESCSVSGELEAPALAAALHVYGAWERRAARGQEVVDLRPKDEHPACIHLQAAEGRALVPAVERRLEREVVHARLVKVVASAVIVPTDDCDHASRPVDLAQRLLVVPQHGRAVARRRVHLVWVRVYLVWVRALAHGGRAGDRTTTCESTITRSPSRRAARSSCRSHASCSAPSPPLYGTQRRPGPRLQRTLAARVALGPPEGRLLVRAEHEDAVARSWHERVVGLRAVETRGEAVALEVVKLVVADQVEHGRAQPALAQRCVPPIRQVAELRHRDNVERVPPVDRPTQLNKGASEGPSHGACIVIPVVHVCELHVCNEPEREQRPLGRRWSARGHALRVPVAHGTNAEDGSSKPSQPAAVWRSLLHIPSREPTSEPTATLLRRCEASSEARGCLPSQTGNKLPVSRRSPRREVCFGRRSES
eukprot:scaffold41232_cov66-Phaeocystis_antarctica.AAC.6